MRIRDRSLQIEAVRCRKMAKQFAGRPEEPFLLKIASAMEEITVVNRSRRT
jgi:hypothetical protein